MKNAKKFSPQKCSLLRAPDELTRILSRIVKKHHETTPLLFKNKYKNVLKPHQDHSLYLSVIVRFESQTADVTDTTNISEL